ncbi:MAG TPA: hypothetical protein VMG81_00670 [Thermoplasmata archaeon]|nr:hypothetical protein [Thermoplasmata archaeon]
MENRDHYWHGCGLPFSAHTEVSFGDRYVALVPPHAPWPCTIVDLDPGAERRVLTREQMRERYLAEKARREARA